MAIKLFYGEETYLLEAKVKKMKKEFGITTFEGMTAAFCGRTELNPEEKERVRQLLEDLNQNE